MKNLPGQLITIEGGEGVGKSLFVKLLSQKIQSMGIKHIVTREPGGTIIAEKLRKIFTTPPKSEKICKEAELLLISAARAQHIKEKIKPALEQGHWVLCDRFIDSTFVYQGHLGGIKEKIIQSLINFSSFNINIDLSFLLDCDVKISQKRLKSRLNKSTDIHKSRFDEADEKFHKTLRSAFLEQAKKNSERFIVLNSAQTPEELITDSITAIKKRILV